MRPEETKIYMKTRVNKIKRDLVQKNLSSLKKIHLKVFPLK